MTWFLRRCLAPGLFVLMPALLVFPQPVSATLMAAQEMVSGVATGDIDDDGEMTPTGNGRFKIDDRVYVGESVARLVAGPAAACFEGDFRSVEEWSLEAPGMVGVHESMVTIVSKRGSLTLRLRGEMERLKASGEWQVVRSSGDCSTVDGDGQYTASFSSERSGPNVRLTFEGETRG